MTDEGSEAGLALDLLQDHQTGFNDCGQRGHNVDALNQRLMTQTVEQNRAQHSGGVGELQC